jgi:hypothetical protein
MQVRKSPRHPRDFVVHSGMPAQKCFSLLLGARNTPTAGKHFTQADEEQIRSITFRYFSNGFTILNATGGWFDPAQKRFIEEDSRQILVCAASLRSLRRWLDELARALHQRELLVIEVGPAVAFGSRAGAGVTKHRVRSTAS